MGATGTRKSERWRVAAVVALSGAVGSGWLLTEAYPSEMAFPFAGFVHFATIALVGAVCSIRSGRRGLSTSRIAGVAAAGLGVFVLPGVVGQLTAGVVSPQTSVAILCAVPLMMVLGIGRAGAEAEGVHMMPALVGLGGALLLFSVEVPGSLRRVVALAAVFATCALTAWASAAIFRLMQGVSPATAVTVVGVAGALVLGGYSEVVGWPKMTPAMIGLEVLRCAAFDLPVVWLSVRLMRVIPPVRLASRFLIAPLVTWIESYAMVRGTIEVRSVAALAALGAGAGMLLWRKDETEPVEGLRLR